MSTGTGRSRIFYPISPGFPPHIEYNYAFLIRKIGPDCAKDMRDYP